MHDGHEAEGGESEGGESEGGESEGGKAEGGESEGRGPCPSLRPTADSMQSVVLGRDETCVIALLALKGQTTREWTANGHFQYRFCLMTLDVSLFLAVNDSRLSLSVSVSLSLYL